MAVSAVCPVCFHRAHLDFSEWVNFPFFHRFHYVCGSSFCGHGWVEKVTVEIDFSELKNVPAGNKSPENSYCPDCMGLGTVRTSRSKIKGILRKSHCQCNDSQCGNTWVQYKEFEYTKAASALSDSKTQHPRLIYGDWSKQIREELSIHLGTKTTVHKKTPI